MYLSKVRFGYFCVSGKTAGVDLGEIKLEGLNLGVGVNSNSSDGREKDARDGCDLIGLHYWVTF